MTHIVLVAWSRLGSSYSRAETTTALEERRLVELRAIIRPAESLALFRARMAAWADGTLERGWQKGFNDWVRTNDACRQDILARLDASGPLQSRELPDSCVKPPADPRPQAHHRPVRVRAPAWSSEVLATTRVDLQASVASP